MSDLTLGQVVHTFIVDHLQIAKGLRPSSIASYRDGLRLFLRFVAADVDTRITALPLSALTTERVLRFLRSLEDARHNHIRTRNQRLAMLRTFFGYLGGRVPELLAVAEQVASIPTKRVAPPETYYLDRTEIEALFAGLPFDTPTAARDRTLLLFLYNTGARVGRAARAGTALPLSVIAPRRHAGLLALRQRAPSTWCAAVLRGWERFFDRGVTARLEPVIAEVQRARRRIETNDARHAHRLLPQRLRNPRTPAPA